MYSLVDMAIYPVLFNQYLAYFAPEVGAPVRWGVSLVLIWGTTAVNLAGAGRVGRVSVWAGAFVLGAFLLLAAGALPRVAHWPWVPLVAPGHHVGTTLGVGLSIALWNYVGWDNASTVQGEVVQASRSYPRALARALPLVVLAYLVPLLPALGATNWTRWHDGGWPDIARDAVAGWPGHVIAVLLAVGGMVSAVALFNALLMAYSRIPFAMARDGVLPAPFARVDGRGVPRVAVLVSAVCYSVFTLAPFGELVVADVALYSAALFLEFAALVWFRAREPGRRGAFRIPVGTAGVVALASSPVLVMLLVVALGLRDGAYAAPALAGAGIAMAAGVPVYGAVLMVRGHRARAHARARRAGPRDDDPSSGDRAPARAHAPGATST